MEVPRLKGHACLLRARVQARVQRGTRHMRNHEPGHKGIARAIRVDNVASVRSGYADHGSARIHGDRSGIPQRADR